MNTSFAFSPQNFLKPSQIQAYVEQQVRRRTVELERTIQELNEQNTYLLNLHAEKNDWLQMLVHDLKNPLASIMLAASFLERYWQKMSLTEFRRNTATIQTSADRMNALIGRVLSISALESGVMDLAMDSINASSLLSATVQDYNNRAEVKNINITLEVAPTDAYVYADRCALLEIIDNLLSNAVKYSPQHSTISIRTFTDVKRKMLRIEFHDQGPGIKPDEFEKLFTKFARLSSKPTGGEHSSGLGLAVVEKLVKAMQGNVWCESEYGQGSTFIIEFPISQPKQYLDVVETEIHSDEDTSLIDNSPKASLSLAINGYDAVGYFLVGRPLQGNPSIMIEWNGKQWLFENEQHKKIFLENPSRFTPKYHGYCALGMSRNLLGYGNPDVWNIVDNELYFAHSPDVLQEWMKKQGEYIITADEYWKDHEQSPSQVI